MAAMGADYREVDAKLQRFESMRSDRVDFDRKWQLVSDYILPRRDFSITQRPNQPAAAPGHASSVATNANTRMAALVLAYWWDPTRPNLLPNVKRGLAVAGRRTELDDGGINYLGDLAWNGDGPRNEPAQGPAAAAHRLQMLKEFCGFGNGVLWTGRRRGFRAVFQWPEPPAPAGGACNEEGVVEHPLPVTC